VRQLQVLVSDDDREVVAAVFEAENVDFVRQQAWIDGRRKWQFSAPVPSDAIGYLLGELKDSGVDDEQLVISTLASAQTPHSELLQSRFASGFDPLTQPEIVSKARDMSQDPTSFLAMIFLSAVIAAAGLLIGSPAIVVGSMVIAPIVGPVLTATVGATVGDRQMLLDSLWLQTVGLVVAVGGAALFAAAVLVGGGFAVDARYHDAGSGRRSALAGSAGGSRRACGGCGRRVRPDDEGTNLVDRCDDRRRVDSDRRDLGAGGCLGRTAGRGRLVTAVSYDDDTD